MKRKLKILDFRKRKGQAFAELSIMMAVLLVLVFGSIELAKMISMSTRMAAVAREAGRTVNAQEYDPEQIDDAFGIVTNMVYPANMQTEGRVIISFVQRAAGTKTNFYTTAPTNTNRDYLVIIDRFYYPYQGTNTRVAATNDSRTSWTTKLPAAFDNGLTGTNQRFIPFSNNVGPVPLNMLTQGTTTAVVEVFYTNRILAPLQQFGVTVPPYLYDVAAF